MGKPDLGVLSPSVAMARRAFPELGWRLHTEGDPPTFFPLTGTDGSPRDRGAEHTAPLDD